MDENPYDKSTSKLDTKRIFAAEHHDGIGLVIYSILAGKPPEMDRKDLYRKGISDIIANDVIAKKALKLAERVNNLFKTYDPSKIPEIMASIRDYRIDCI